MSEWIVLHKPQELNIRDTIIEELSNIDVWWKELATKLKSLLSAKTLNAKWDEMDDNKAQLEALKLILKMHWLKMWWDININLFNIPNPNERLKY